MKNVNQMVEFYCNQLKNPELQIAYEYLIKFIMRLKANFVKHKQEKFTFGNISPGYMDFSYFPFYNPYLKKQNLRFGIVLNHKAMSFELWLMGQNAKVQDSFWQIFKTSPWMKDYAAMPRYNVLEMTLADQLDFTHENELMSQIIDNALPKIDDVLDFLKSSVSQ